MSKPKDAPRTPPPDSSHKPTAFESIRETFDSIAIAFILAFLFRSFQAEAFVIPTGSMALTLMGAHKEINCPECGMHYRVGASEEFPEDENKRPRRVTSSVCPNCRYRDAYPVDNPPATFNGDRILVTKFPYEFSDPERFDVAVFKNPGEAKQNYIKRVMGLPKEEVLLYRGDVYARKPDATKFTIARKPHDKVLATAQSVYDNNRVLPKIIELGWPQRWAATQPNGEIAPGDAANWLTSADYKSFRATGKSPTETWLRYRHILPDDRSWRLMNDGPLSDEARRQLCIPQLITDFCEYNTGESGDGDISFAGLHWVGDLILECDLEFSDRSGDDAEAILELVEGGRSFQCRINAASGDVELRIDGVPDYHPRAKAKVVGRGPHRLRFANVDDHLLLWVGEHPVAFDASTNFLGANAAPVIKHGTDELGHRREVTMFHQLDGDTSLPALDIAVPKEQDLRSPAGIGVRGVDVAISNLHLKRDMYSVADTGIDGSRHFSRWSGLEPSTVTDYRNNVFQNFERSGLTEFASRWQHSDTLRAFMSDVKTDPTRWNQLSAATFQLEADQFFVLGDNSAKSLDGRLWNEFGYESYVKRELLIGKALFVYWPHGLETVPGTTVGLPSLPYFGRQYGPNFGAMRLIR